MALHAVHHVAILVSDYQASRHFYVDLLGFTVLRENFRPEKNDWKLDLILDGVELEIFSAPAAPPRPDRPEALGLRHLAFRVEDMEREAAALGAKGIPTEPIRMDPYSQKRFTFFRDPDGLPLELHE
ncbi:VOC family protein [Gemmiger formicilis]|uniref:SMU1112c/YaeR family gloxylase I-like metalloprotein n=1 Tax=Gemmiger formicilis TaxID=745368 RepID=UPI001959FAC9|nr:VOC family protein [Gemmiger formicilis]MBM6915098.1 VOC family protein [Gemmiger formicilis]